MDYEGKTKEELIEYIVQLENRLQISESERFKEYLNYTSR